MSGAARLGSERLSRWISVARRSLSVVASRDLDLLMAAAVAATLAYRDVNRLAYEWCQAVAFEGADVWMVVLWSGLIGRWRRSRRFRLSEAVFTTVLVTIWCVLAMATVGPSDPLDTGPADGRMMRFDDAP